MPTLAQLGIARGRRGRALVGPLAPGDYRALLRRARVFVCAPRREDYGIAQLEALADGCLLVTTPAPGPYVALPIARELDARLVSEDLAPRTARCARRPPARLRRPRAAGARAVPARRGRPAGRASSYFRDCWPSAACRARRTRARAARWPRRGLSATRAAPWRRPSACSRASSCGARLSRSAAARRRRAAARALTSDRSRRSGLALISIIVLLRAAAAKTASRSIAYGARRSISRPVGWPIARTSGCSIAAIIRSVIACSLIAKRRVHARDQPVELGQQLVLVVERAVGQDVDLAAREQLDALDRRVCLAHELDLATQLLGRDVVAEAVRGGVVGDREVLIAPLAGGQRHLLDRVVAVGGDRVAVQVAADV